MDRYKRIIDRFLSKKVGWLLLLFRDKAILHIIRNHNRNKRHCRRGVQGEIRSKETRHHQEVLLAGGHHGCDV